MLFGLLDMVHGLETFYFYDYSLHVQCLDITKEMYAMNFVLKESHYYPLRHESIMFHDFFFIQYQIYCVT